MDLEAEQAEEELASIERTIRRDTRLAWLNLYLPQKSIELVDAGIALVRGQEEAARIRMTTGKAQLFDVTRVQIESGRERDRRADLEAQAARARAELARWIGRDAERNLAGLPEWKPPSAAAALNQQLHEHPQMRLARREIEVAENEVAQAQARKKPDWSVELAYSRRGPLYADMLGVQFAIELPVFPENRQDREVAAKAAQKSRVENMHLDHERRLAAELAAFHADWEGANQRIAEFDRDLLPHASSRIDATLAAYAAGRADLAAVLDARRMHLDLRLQRLALEVALQKARVQLDYFEESGEQK
jgi:cobalt-zinc-cadmium efflux system outer membrane protein